MDTSAKCKADVALGDTTVFNTVMLCKKLNLYYVDTSIVSLCSVISALSPCCKFFVGPAQMFCLSCAKIRGISVVCQGNMLLLAEGKS